MAFSFSVVGSKWRSRLIASRRDNCPMVQYDLVAAFVPFLHLREPVVDLLGK
jgi:hypothetical protein